jgi:phosphate transport system protein
MKQDPEIVLGGTNYMRISTYLERIGDYVTNISEWIIYLDSGEVVELNVHHKI